jgi:acetyltransferase-like isoleucine patch superfamily enzyme
MERISGAFMNYPYPQILWNQNDRNPPKIAEGVYLNGFIDCIWQVTIEKDVFSGHDITILTGSHDYTKFGKERINSGAEGGGAVYIEEGVWLCSKCIIIGPCRIGKHSVIGAGSVVTKNVPAYQVWAGAPARFIKGIPHEHY